MPDHGIKRLARNEGVNETAVQRLGHSFEGLEGDSTLHLSFLENREG